MNKKITAQKKRSNLVIALILGAVVIMVALSSYRMLQNALGS